MELQFVHKFKALSDEFRFTILLTLLRAGKPLCVNEISDRVKAAQTRVSRNINLMKSAGLLVSKRDGVKIYYYINTKDELATKIGDCIANKFNIDFEEK